MMVEEVRQKKETEAGYYNQQYWQVVVVLKIIVQCNTATQQQTTAQQGIFQPNIVLEETTQKRQRNHQEWHRYTMDGAQHG